MAPVPIDKNMRTKHKIVRMDGQHYSVEQPRNPEDVSNNKDNISDSKYSMAHFRNIYIEKHIKKRIYQTNNQVQESQQQQQQQEPIDPTTQGCEFSSRYDSKGTLNDHVTNNNSKLIISSTTANSKHIKPDHNNSFSRVCGNRSTIVTNGIASKTENTTSSARGQISSERTSSNGLQKISTDKIKRDSTDLGVNQRKSSPTKTKSINESEDTIRSKAERLFIVSLIRSTAPSLVSETSSLITNEELGFSDITGFVDDTEDDPCESHDSTNTIYDTDKESDLEYVGWPLYLAEDGAEKRQSQHIRSSGTSAENSDSSNTWIYYKPASVLSPSLFPNVAPYINFSNYVEKGPPIPTSLHKILKWRVSNAMPKVVKRVVLNSGCRLIRYTNDWMAVWEKHMKSTSFRTIRSNQKYNHLPGTCRLGRKDVLWSNIRKNVEKFGRYEFGIMQRTFIMPDQMEELRKVWPQHALKQSKWIIKPPASARGTGILIIDKWSEFPKDIPLIVQKYIERPLLINGNKFDMRLYVLVTSINPLRIYMFKDGLARFASVKYNINTTNLANHFMHLTNYSINKFSEKFTQNEDFNSCQGHKWTLYSLWCYLEERGIDTKRIWATLRNLVIKAILSAEAGLNRCYRQNVNFRYSCFEMFGFDVLLDENLVPWLLEINISPSLHSDMPIDNHIKGQLLQAVLNTALYQVPPKLNDEQQKEILNELNLKAPLCEERRLFSTSLRSEEIRKHNHFTSRSIEYREEYLDAILEDLMPDDIRCLIIAEDELARCKPLERIFPTPDTHTYLRFIESPRYYNRLMDAWEHRYGNCREEGHKLLTRYCEEQYHLKVSEAALKKEPTVTWTDIDLIHAPQVDINSIAAAINEDQNNKDASKQNVKTRNDNHKSLKANDVDNMANHMKNVVI